MLAAVLLTSAGFAIAPRSACAEEEISEDARRHFKAGVAFLQDPDGERPEEAYIEFKLAYDLSKSPKVLGNLALCAMKLERDGEAIDAYKRYAMEVFDIDDAERRQVNSDIAMLTASTVRMTIRVDAPQTRLFDTRVSVRGAPITNIYGPVDDTIELRVRAGHHRIQAKSGGTSADWEIDAVAGSTMSHDFRLAAAPSPPPAERPAEGRERSKTGPVITMGLGGAMLATSAVTGLIALSKVNALTGKCPNDECPAGYDYESARSSARTFIGLTDILLVGGAVAMIGGAVWFFWPTDASRAAPPAAGSATATCTSEGCGAMFRYKFQ